MLLTGDQKEHGVFALPSLYKSLGTPEPETARKVCSLRRLDHSPAQEESAVSGIRGLGLIFHEFSQNMLESYIPDQRGPCVHLAAQWAAPKLSLNRGYLLILTSQASAQPATSS